MTDKVDELGHDCVQTGLKIGRAISKAIYSMKPKERAKPSESILKKTTKLADAQAERVACQVLEKLSKSTGYSIHLIVDPVKGDTYSIGASEKSQVIYCYLDPVDGTVTVAGLGGEQYQANTGNWGVGIAFTPPKPREQPPQELVIGDFIYAVIATGNPRRNESAPNDVFTLFETDRLCTYDSEKRRVYTSSQKGLSQSFVFFDGFQGHDRSSTKNLPGGCEWHEKMVVELYGRLMNRNNGGAFDLKRDYGNLSALVANMLGWRQEHLPESQGGAYVVVNEDLSNMIPCVSIILGAGGIAVDFEGNQLQQRKLRQGRTSVVYAANQDIYPQVRQHIVAAKIAVSNLIG